MIEHDYAEEQYLAALREAEERAASSGARLRRAQLFSIAVLWFATAVQVGVTLWRVLSPPLCQ